MMLNDDRSKVRDIQFVEQKTRDDDDNNNYNNDNSIVDEQHKNSNTFDS